MESGPRSRARGTGARARQDPEGAGRPPGDTLKRAHAAARAGVLALRAAAASLLLYQVGCAGTRPPLTQPQPSPSARGYRALFRGESEGAGGRGRFRLAVAILPPDRVRLEFFGAIGGPRAILAATSDQAVALLPAERAYEEAVSSAEIVEKLMGVPLGSAELIALLTGTPMCGQESIRVEVRTRPAATFGRTLSWYQVSCPPGEIRYQARCEERGGTLLSAVVSEGISGAIILEADYGDYGKGLGPRWPRQVRLRLPGRGATIHLAALEGPWASEVPESLFRPEIPEGFERRSLRLLPGAPGLPGVEPDPVR